MKTNNSIFETFKEGFDAGFYKRLNGNPALDLYVGKNDSGLYSFEYRGAFTPIKVKCSELILVEQFKHDSFNSICFLLEKDELLERFSIFCQDLADAVDGITDVNQGYKEICNRFFSWKKLFKPSTGNLTEPEIMGIIGELLFLKDTMIPTFGVEKAIESWMGPEKTHKDFSFDDKWIEIKTVSSGKELVKISSIEQLDGNENGSLVVFALEKMSTNYKGLKLNNIVNELLINIHNQFVRDVFMSKLSTYGYEGSPEYDNYVYEKTDYLTFAVTEDFPRLRRDLLPRAIAKSQYEIILSELDTFKSTTPWR